MSATKVPPFWNLDDVQLFEQADTLGQLARVALRVLDRMPQEVVEVCGPISTGGLGSAERNLERFQRAIDVLRVKKPLFSVFDQLPFQIALARLAVGKKGKDGYCYEILTEFYRPIFRSGLVKRGYFLSDWRSSVGATWERVEMEQCGIVIADFPDAWFD